MKNTLEKIATYCDRYSARVFNAKITPTQSTALIEFKDSIDDYLYAALQDSVKTFFKEEKILNFENISNIQYIKNLSLDDEIYSEIASCYNELKDKEGDILEVTFYWIKNGAIISFTETSEYSDYYDDLIAFSENIYVSPRPNFTSFDDSFPDTIEEQLKTLADKILSSNEYTYQLHVRRNPELLSSLAKKLFGATFIENLLPINTHSHRSRYETVRLMTRLDEYVRFEYEKARLEADEKIIIQSIQKMRLSRTPKNAIAAKLNISINRLNSLIYKDTIINNNAADKTLFD